jgi:XTP/dITP diphosphohydrolase
MKEIVFATNNVNKIKEIKILLPSIFHIKKLIDIGCNEELPETHHTIEENSAEKANYVFSKYKINCFSEDSGLEIDMLNGEPGVDSAHYAGTRDANLNIGKVLNKMKGEKNRKANFKTVITLILNGIQYQFVGILDGTIALEKRGLYGFGYDPIFILKDGRTMAELMLDEKSRISHRGIAVKKLISFLDINH